MSIPLTIIDLSTIRFNLICKNTYVSIAQHQHLCLLIVKVLHTVVHLQQINKSIHYPPKLLGKAQKSILFWFKTEKAKERTNNSIKF